MAWTDGYPRHDPPVARPEARTTSGRRERPSPDGVPYRPAPALSIGGADGCGLVRAESPARLARTRRRPEAFGNRSPGGRPPQARPLAEPGDAIRGLPASPRPPSVLHRVRRPDYNPRLRSRPRPDGAAERCQSGRSGRSRKPLCLRGYRGFESHPLRQRAPSKHRRDRNSRFLTAAGPLYGPFPCVKGWPSRRQPRPDRRSAGMSAPPRRSARPGSVLAG